MRAPALIAATALVLAATPARAQVLSPGPLSSSHKSVEGDTNCGKCHVSGKRVGANLCLACHRDLGARIRAGAGLHGKAYRGRPCERCHIEHIGRKHDLVRWPRGSRARFNHNQAGWPLAGAHARVGCDKCHDKRNGRGAKTYLGLKTACASCHSDPHKSRFGSACKSCHTESDWKKVEMSSFDHDKSRYPLRGAHQRVDCKTCHGQPARYTGLKFSDCADCHEDPHKGRFRRMTCKRCHVETDWKSTDGFRKNHPGLRLSAGHRRVKCVKCHDRGNLRRPSKGRRCESCHRPIHLARFSKRCKTCHASIRWVGLPARIGLANHGKTRYPLRGRHKKTACARCHPTSKPQSKRFRNLPFGRCDSCHADQHSGAFAAHDKGECAACHTVAGFSPTTFGVAQHAKMTTFALTGKHLAARCTRCHPGERPRLAFKVANKTCAGCHANPHGDQFATEMARGGCAQCHSTAGWKQPNIDHSSWPLTGAHQRTACSACHSPSAADRARGAGATYRGVPRDCEGCHPDVHAGQFRLSKPVKRCERCHTTAEFKIPRFDHETEASYPLTGGHKKVGCPGCHPTQTLRTGKTAVRYRLGYRACKDCHKNPHPD